MTTNVISFLTPKGGAGKTSLAVATARGLVMRKNNVLLVDSDPQRSSLDWSAEGEGKSGVTVVGMAGRTLKKDVDAMRNSGSYEWIIIDGAGGVSREFTANNASAICASDLVVIPMQASAVDIWACTPLVDTIHQRQEITDGLPTAAFVLNRVKKGTRLSKEIGKAIKEFDLPILNGTIHDRTVHAASFGTGDTALDIEPGGQAAWEINHMIKQFEDAFHG